jgi:hypothetical protein
MFDFRPRIASGWDWVWKASGIRSENRSMNQTQLRFAFVCTVRIEPLRARSGYRFGARRQNSSL